MLFPPARSHRAPCSFCPRTRHRPQTLFRVHRDLSGENLVLAFFCRFAGQTIPDIRLVESEVFNQCCYGRIDVRMGIVLFFIFYRRIGKFTVENNVVNLLTRCQNRSVPVGDTSPLEWNCPAVVGLLRLA